MRIIALTLITASVLASCGNEPSKKDKDDKKDTVIKTEVASTNAGDLTIAYYETEKLTTDFDFYKKTSSELEKEGGAIQKNLENWQRTYELNARKMTEGMQNGTLSTSQIEGYDKKVKDAEKNIVAIQQNQMMAFQTKQQKLTEVLDNKLKKYSEDFAKANGIKMLYSKGPGSPISYIDPAFDVTDAFVKYMNAKEKEIDAIAD